MSKSVMPMRWSSSCRRGEPEASTIFAMAAPSLSGGAEAAPVGTVQMLHFGEGRGWFFMMRNWQIRAFFSMVTSRVA